MEERTPALHTFLHKKREFDLFEKQGSVEDRFLFEKQAMLI
jgi:hypothetical protein